MAGIYARFACSNRGRGITLIRRERGARVADICVLPHAVVICDRVGAIHEKKTTVAAAAGTATCVCVKTIVQEYVEIKLQNM
jgi:hypothetical protein